MAYIKNKSQKIKAYLDRLQYPTGLKSYEIAEKLGIQAVTYSLISARFDEASGQHIYKLAKIFGVDPGVFLTELIRLRKEENEEAAK